jgi:hypothetical protein
MMVYYKIIKWLILAKSIGKRVVYHWIIHHELYIPWYNSPLGAIGIFMIIKSNQAVVYIYITIICRYRGGLIYIFFPQGTCFGDDCDRLLTSGCLGLKPGMARWPGVVSAALWTLPLQQLHCALFAERPFARIPRDPKHGIHQRLQLSRSRWSWVSKCSPCAAFRVFA